MQQRIYQVTNKETKESRMIKAGTQAQALRYAAREDFDINAATALDVANHMTSGKTIEDATKEIEHAGD